MSITHICSWVPWWHGSCFSCLWVLGTFVTHVVTDLKRRVGCVGTVIREVFPIFQLALSSPVNWDSKAQNDRWEKWGRWVLALRIMVDDIASGTLQPLLKILNGHLRSWKLVTRLRTQEFSWNWRWQAEAKPNCSASKAHTRKELVFSFKINRTFHICLEGGTMSCAAK